MRLIDLIYQAEEEHLGPAECDRKIMKNKNGSESHRVKMKVCGGRGQGVKLTQWILHKESSDATQRNSVQRRAHTGDIKRFSLTEDHACQPALGTIILGIATRAVRSFGC